MTTVGNLLLGWLVVFIAALAIEGYVLLGRVDRLAQWTQQLLGAANDLLATQPGKSAPRTEAPPDVQPRVWWQKLRTSADAREATVQAAVDAMAAAVDGVLTTTAPEPAALVPLAEATTETVNVVNSDGEIVARGEVPALPHDRPRPSPGPATVPAEAVIDAWHRDVTEVIPVPDAADVALARFGLRPHLTEDRRET